MILTHFKEHLTAVTLVSSAWIRTNSNEQGTLPNPKIREDVLPHMVRLKGFAVEMINAEDEFCTNADFTKLLSYVEDE